MLTFSFVSNVCIEVRVLVSSSENVMNWFTYTDSIFASINNGSSVWSRNCTLQGIEPSYVSLDGTPQRLSTPMGLVGDMLLRQICSSRKGADDHCRVANTVRWVTLFRLQARMQIVHSFIQYIYIFNNHEFNGAARSPQHGHAVSLSGFRAATISAKTFSRAFKSRRSV